MSTQSLLQVENLKVVDQVQIPPEAEMINLNGKTLLPRLIDWHIHIDLHGLANTYEENLVEDKLRTIRTAKAMETTSQAHHIPGTYVRRRLPYTEKRFKKRVPAFMVEKIINTREIRSKNVKKRD